MLKTVTLPVLKAEVLHEQKFFYFTSVSQAAVPVQSNSFWYLMERPSFILHSHSITQLGATPSLGVINAMII